MRFGTGPDSILVPIRWYPTNKPFLGFPTVYNSHRYVESRDWPSFDLGTAGEVWGAARHRVPPSPVSIPSGDAPKGSREAWLGAYQVGDPLYPCGTMIGAYSREYSWAYDRVS